MTADPFDSPQFRAYSKRVREELIPKIEKSAVAVSLVNGTTDVKFAVELGFMIMLDKPIIALVTPGMKVPEKLVLVADEIVEGDINDPTMVERLNAAIRRIGARNEDGFQ